MKVFKWKHILLIVCVVLLIAALFLLVAFKSSMEDVQRWSLFSTMFFGLASICLSFLALAISVNTYIISSRQKREKLENEANSFIVSHEDELAYIPLCLIASAYKRQGKCLRQIYLDFNRLSNELQKEVLKQLNYDCELISSTDWIDNGLEKVKKYISDNELGRDLLYDDSKYFKRAYNYRNHKYDLCKEYSHLFRSDLLGKPNYIQRGLNVTDDGISFDEYLNRYLRAREEKSPIAAVVAKPIDALASAIRFNDCDEETVCFWMMVMVDSCAEQLIDRLSKQQQIKRLPVCEGSLETYEDRFFVGLSTLYDLCKFKDKK